MKLKIITVLAFVLCSSLNADSPAMPTPLVFTSEYGSDVFFKMVPARYDKNYEIKKEAYGVVSRLNENGLTKELYRTNGWYSFTVFVSEDGDHLVRMGPWSVGSKPEKEDLAIAFYERGNLLKQYSTADLVKNPKKVERSVSHYVWQAPGFRNGPPSEAEKQRYRLYLEYNNTFKLYTIDGWTYTFDASTGDILSEEKTKG